MQRTSLSSAALVVSVAVLFSQLSLSLAGSHSPTPMPTTGGLGLQDVDFTRIPVVPANETEINACCRDDDGSAGTSETLLLTPGNVGRQGACLFDARTAQAKCGAHACITLDTCLSVLVSFAAILQSVH
jgi:hypothetical protein